METCYCVSTILVVEKANSVASASEAVASAAETAAIDDLPVYSREQVSWHANSESCWIVIDNLVYDVTEFLKQHPGGAEVLLENAGADCTEAFKDTGHSGAARQQLANYLVGRLPARKLTCSESIN
uniref:Cytochrome b5 heme-binding domain-containing protein n=1 Tax=Macrostomum lignano TaxID=282301 RepID=A0A1I8GH37_9PLAT